MAILIADDNAVARKALVLMLRYAGLEVDAADGGNSCLRMFKQRHYDLVISDIDMPDMNGVVLARELLRIRPEVPLYAFSGSSGTQLLDEANRVFSKVFHKPVEMKALIAEVTEQLPLLAVS